MSKHYVVMEYTNANGETKNQAMRSVDVAEFLIKYPNAKRVAGQMSVVSSKINKQSKEMENKKMVKVALVISTVILGVFSFIIANAYAYLSLITNEVDNSVHAGQWNLVGTQFLISAFVLALVFVIRSRKK